MSNKSESDFVKGKSNFNSLLETKYQDQEDFELLEKETTQDKCPQEKTETPDIIDQKVELKRETFNSDNFHKLIYIELLVATLLASVYLGNYYLMFRTTYNCKENACVEYSQIFQHSKILTDYTLKSELITQSQIFPFKTSLMYQKSVNGCSEQIKDFLTQSDLNNIFVLFQHQDGFVVGHYIKKLYSKKHWFSQDTLDFVKAMTDSESFIFTLGRQGRIPFDILKFEENQCSERNIWKEIEIHQMEPVFSI